MAVLSKVANIAVQPQPVGVVEAFAGTNAPNGWLICDGSQVLRSLYPELFSVIGTTYGSGDGFSTFTLPDLRGRTIAGKDGVNNMNNGPTNRLTSTYFGASGTALGNSGGNEAHTLTTAQLASHNHTGTSDGANTTLWLQDQAGNPLYRLSGYTGSSPGGSIGGWALNNGSTGANDRLLASAHTHTFTTATNGSGNAHNNTQPTMILNYIIKAVSELPRGGWYNSSSPDVVTALPTNPYVGQEVLHQDGNNLIYKRYNGSTWVRVTTTPRASQGTRGSQIDITGTNTVTVLSTTITPQDTSSKILINISGVGWLNGSSGDYSFGDKILRNSNAILTRSEFMYFAATTNQFECWGLTWLDSPSSTSALTYDYQIVGANRGNMGFSRSATTAITLTEILQ